MNKAFYNSQLYQFITEGLLIKTVILVLAFIYFASCSPLRISYDYDRDTDFTAYSTYNYYPELETGLSELDSRRLLRALDSTLQLKGLQFSEEPDFLINIQSRMFQGVGNSSVGVGIGGTGRNMGGGVSVGLPLGQSQADREIILDFIDSQKDALFWQAVMADQFREGASPSEREARLRAMVQKALSKYPPKK